MTHYSASIVLCLCIGVACPARTEARPPEQDVQHWADPRRDDAERTVFLGGNLGDEDRITLTSAIAGSGHPGLVLFDSDKSRQPTEWFLREFHPSHVLPVGSFTQERGQLEDRLQCAVAPIQSWHAERSDLAQALFANATRLVVSPAQPRRLLLQAACLAGAYRAALFVVHDVHKDGPRLKRCLKDWPIEHIYAVGTGHWCRSFTKLPIHSLPDEKAVAARYLKLCLKKGPIETLVVANPADIDAGRATSALGPWLALGKRAPLLLTNPAGDNVESLVRAAVTKSGVEKANALILLGDLHALPMLRRPNPLPGGKDAFIEMEPMTPSGDSPYSFAVGRLFHDDINLVALMLARSRLLRRDARPKALVVSNPGGGLPLLESFSRNTAREFVNSGYDTTALFNNEVSRAELRRLLPQQSIFLWEGHYATLVRNYGVHQWAEPLRPSLVFLQSCLALSEDKALPFLNRGACAVIGTSTRTYSASGGAFALAYFDSLLYEQQSLGGALRQAKNFLHAFARLKEKRLGAQAKMGGANIRTAWAFTLWGDPTLTLAAPKPPTDALLRVNHEVRGNSIRITVPEVPHEKSKVGNYETEIWANSRIGGLVRTRDMGSRRLVPLVFTEIHLPKAPHGKTPRLNSKLPGRNWVFCWDGRRQRGYLLALPRSNDAELRFRVSWD